MTPDLQTSLNQYFGFSSFRPGQEHAIRSLINAKHTLAVMPTGSGKSLIFQLASLFLPGLTLVISPLIALMKDQVDGLERHGIAATFINSSIPASEQSLRLQGMSQGKYRIVYLAPERLRNSKFLEAVRGINISLLAVDEAHCISEWGHDFRPDYLHIAKFREIIGDPVTVALTATATPQVQTDISKFLKLDQPTLIVNGFNRPNLTLTVRQVLNPKHRYRLLGEAVLSNSEGATIIYTGTRRDAEEVAEFVQSVLGINARYYHAGLDNESRTEIQNEFIQRNLAVIVATNAFGMGIDRPDVRQVIHFNMPGSLEAYYQEAGRAGRDGKPSRALLLYANQDRALQEYFIRNAMLPKTDILKIYNAFNSRNNQPLAISVETLSTTTGMDEVKIKIGLSALELSGVIIHMGDEGTRMIIRKNPWQDHQIEAAVERSTKQQMIRAKQLQSMVNYAESDQCRRRMILRYFGDKSYVAVEECCDNCLPRQALRKTQPENKPPCDLLDPALLILETVQQLKYGVGSVKIAQLLKGSKSKELSNSALRSVPNYGKLSGIKIDSIRFMIEQLIMKQLLKLTGGQYPVVRLTPEGARALHEKTSIHLSSAKKPEDKKPARKTNDQLISETVQHTWQLFDSGLSIDQIASQRKLSVHTIYSHLIVLIKNRKIKIKSVLPEHVIQLVEAVIKETGQVERLTPLKERLPDEIDFNMIRCVAENWKGEHQSNPSDARIPEDHSPVEQDAIDAFLSKDHPCQIPGPWQAGWALGFHSSFQGSDWARSSVGELAFQLKYQGDFSAIDPLVEKMKRLVCAHPEVAQVDAIIPVPASIQRQKDPVSSLARELASHLNLLFLPVVTKSRKTEQQKQFRTLAQKKANVAGAFRLQTPIRGKRLLVMDDLFDSGATLEEITRLLKQAGAAKVNVLTITRTIHSDH